MGDYKRESCKDKKEVIALRGTLKEENDIVSVLNLMEKVLNHMTKKEEDIRPPLLKFLMDSKETVKLLMKKDNLSDIDIYKQLAHLGIEARFSCLEGLKDSKPIQPPLSFNEEIDRTEMPMMRGKNIEETLNKMDQFLEKMEWLFTKWNQ